jgi:hypothetical protein
MKNTLLLLRAGFYRISIQPVYWAIVFVSITIPFAGIFSSVDTPTSTILGNMKYAGEKSINIYLSITPTIGYCFLSPFLITLIAIVVIYNEKQANSFKYAFLSPYGFKSYLMSTFFLILFLLSISFFLMFISHLGFMWLFSLLRPELRIDWSAYALFYEFICYWEVFIKSLGVLSIVLLISLLTQHYIPICFFLSIIGLLVPIDVQPYLLAFTNFRVMGIVHKEFLQSSQAQIDLNILQRFQIIDIYSLLYIVIPLIVLFQLPKLIKRNT